MKYFCFVLICFLFISCTRSKKPENPVLVENEISNEKILAKINNDDNLISSEKPEVKLQRENRTIAFFSANNRWPPPSTKIEDLDFSVFPKEERGFAFIDGSTTVNVWGQHAGITCLTNIVENDVHVKNYPSFDSEIIFRLQNNDIVRILGLSGEAVNIDNIYGFWLNVLHQKSDNEIIHGWLFSRYVNLKNIEYSPIRFMELVPGIIRGVPTGRYFLNVSFFVDGNEIIRRYLSLTEWNNYYVVVWGPYDNGFHWTNRPGVYLLCKETHELRHITYLGAFGATSHMWTVFTDDFRYLIQDSGSAPPIRGITVWCLYDMTVVFGGAYYGVKSIQNNTIEYVYRFDDFAISRGRLDEEIILFGKKFVENTPVPQEIIDRSQSDPSRIQPLIRASFNLDTRERKILGGTFTVLQ